MPEIVAHAETGLLVPSEDPPVLAAASSSGVLTKITRIAIRIRGRRGTRLGIQGGDSYL